MKKRVVSIILAIGLITSSGAVYASEVIEGGYIQSQNIPVEDKMSELVAKELSLKEQYFNETNIEKKIAVADELLDITYSIHWYGVYTNARWWNRSDCEKHGVEWEDGYLLYDAVYQKFLTPTELKRNFD
jgi:hypothetical protein